MKSLKHPRIAEYFDHGTLRTDLGAELPWVAMELGEENLGRDIAENGPLYLEDAIKVAIQYGEALQHVHSSGFIHRDVKPENVVWVGPGVNIKMIDFGLAKRDGEDVSHRPLDNFTRQLEFVGAAFYASPELLAYARDKTQVVDARSDIFQFGEVLWYLVTGQVPRGIPSFKAWNGSRSSFDLVCGMMQSLPADRPQSMTDVLTRLKQV